MREPHLQAELVGRFTRITAGTLALFAVLVILVYGATTEGQIRRSLGDAATLAQSLLSLYADPGGEQTTVAPAMLADQLLGMDQPFLITREAGEPGMRDLYFLTPTMPAKRLEGMMQATPEEIRTMLLDEIAQRARWRYAVHHQRSGEFDVYLVASRAPLITGVVVLSLAALALVPITLLLQKRVTDRAVALTLEPLRRMTEATAAIGPGQLDYRLSASMGQAEATRLAEAINGMLERLDASHRRLQTFTSGASHELRTPLTHLRAQVQWALVEERSPQQVLESLQEIERELERATKIVEDLLLIAQGENGLLELEHRSFDVATVVQEVVEIAEAMVEVKALTVEAELDGACYVIGDPNRTRHVLLNLVSNAIRYTDEGGIRIRLRDRAEGCGLEVSDTGPGISSEHLSKIFDRFYRVEESRSRAHGGSGLGLTIAKLLAQLQGGEVTVESTVGRGSTFTLTMEKSLQNS